MIRSKIQQKISQFSAELAGLDLPPDPVELRERIRDFREENWIDLDSDEWEQLTTLELRADELAKASLE